MSNKPPKNLARSRASLVERARGLAERVHRPLIELRRFAVALLDPAGVGRALGELGVDEDDLPGP